MVSLPPLRAACVQFCATELPVENLALVAKGIADAASKGAQFVQLPEMTNLMQIDKTKAWAVLDDLPSADFLAALQELALQHDVWLHVGSLIVPENNYFFNRGYIIDNNAFIHAKYDKIHLFDVDLANGESYRESSAFYGGGQAVLVDTPWGKLGMGICFDVRFPHLYNALATAGATILTAPAAFTATTGAAHWHTLVRARAIENGAIMLACCQGGKHQDGRETFGHSLIVDAWGTILAEGTGAGSQSIIADLDTNLPAQAQAMIPTLKLKKPFNIADNGTLT